MWRYKFHNLKQIISLFFLIKLKYMMIYFLLAFSNIVFEQENKKQCESKVYSIINIIFVLITTVPNAIIANLTSIS